jgi:NADH:ubiquinone oxidoreductase subunit
MLAVSIRGLPSEAKGVYNEKKGSTKVGSETFLNVYWTARYDIPEDSTLHKVVLFNTRSEKH